MFATRLKSRSADQSSPPMLLTRVRDARIGNLSPGNSSGDDQRPQRRPVGFPLSQEHERGRLEPSVRPVERPAQARWRRVDAGMGDSSEKLVSAWPGDRPRHRSLREFRNSLRSSIVKRRVLAMSVAGMFVSTAIKRRDSHSPVHTACPTTRRGENWLKPPALEAGVAQLEADVPPFADTVFRVYRSG